MTFPGSSLSKMRVGTCSFSLKCYRCPGDELPGKCQHGLGKSSLSRGTSRDARHCSLGAAKLTTLSDPGLPSAEVPTVSYEASLSLP